VSAALAIDGVSNFRSAHVDGGACALYRSANLAGLTDRGLDQLLALGIRRIVDLRGTGERLTGLPAIAHDPIEMVTTPIEPKTARVLRELLLPGGATAPQVKDVMIAAYRAYVTEEAEAFGDAIAAIAETPSGAALVHCTAGKDRTGFVVALLQTLSGAPRESVLADYLETNRSWDRASVAGHLPLGSAAVEPVLLADADYLDAAFEAIAMRDGSVEAFIERATRGSVPADRLTALFALEMQA